MPSTLATAYVQILPSTGGMQTTLTEELTKAGDTAGKSSGESFGSSFGNVMKKGGAIAGAVLGASTAVATAMFAQANNTAKAADEIDKASIRMGVSAGYYQQLAFAAGQSGVEMNTLERAAKQLEGTGLNLDEALTSIMALSTEEERAAMASELFGNTVAYNLSPILAQSGDEFEGLMTRAEELGIVMSDEAVGSGVLFKDTLSEVTQSIGALGNALGTSLMPLFQGLAEFILSNMPLFQSMFEQLAPIIAQLGESILSILTPLVTSLLPPLLQLLQPLIELLSPILDLVGQIIVPIAELVGSLIGSLSDLIGELMGGALAPLGEILGFVADILTGVFGGAIQMVIDMVDMLTGVFGGLGDFLTGVFTGNWSQAWDGIVNIFSSIWNGMINLFKTPINWIIDGINFFIRALNMIQIPDWVPLVGGLGFHINEIPKLEKGGVLERGQTGFLEGNGAEAVVPLDQNSKWIARVASDMEQATGSGSSAVLEEIKDILTDIKSMGLYLDGDRLVGGIASKMDKALAKRSVASSRGY